MNTRCAVVKDGIVVNVIVADAATFTIPQHTIVASETANIGDSYDGEAFTAPLEN